MRAETRTGGEPWPGDQSPAEAGVARLWQWPDWEEFESQIGARQIAAQMKHLASLPVWTDFQIARTVSTARLPDCLLRQFEMSVTLLGPSYILPDWCVRQIGSGGIYQRCQASGQIGLAMPDCVLPDWTRLRISPDCQIALARLASDCLRLARWVCKNI